MIENLKQSDFESLSNSKFRLQYGESQWLELVMEKVVDLGSTPQQEQFSIIFRGPLSPSFWQGTYRLEHEKMGQLHLFLVPVGKDENGMSYEAVFNRRIKSS